MNANIIKNTHNNDIILVNGLAKSGKLIIERILEAYDGVQLHSSIDISEPIIWMYNLKKIDKEATIYLLRSLIDRELYEKSICRNINTRLDDGTSVFKYPYPLDYLKKILSKCDRNIDKKTTLNLSMHNSLTYYEILNASLGDRMKIINIHRDPADNIYDMHKYSLYDRISTDPSIIEFNYDVDGNIIPNYAIEWMDDYLEMNKMDRVVNLYLYDMQSNLSSYEEAKNKDNILMLGFDDIVSKPKEICKIIEKFIDKKPTHGLNRLLKKQKCPRRIDMGLRVTKKLYISNGLSPKYKHLLNDCYSVYNEYQKVAHAKCDYSC